ncbi:MAG: hypothetical protein ABIH83_02430 [Candidatus Micrarchaeota archaeon]
MPRKKRKVSMAAYGSECCGPSDIQSYGRGKALFKIALGLLFVTYGFGYLGAGLEGLKVLALVAGALFCLVGVVRMMARNS